MLAVRLLREELQLLQEPGSYVGEVVKVWHPADFQDLSLHSYTVNLNYQQHVTAR